MSYNDKCSKCVTIQKIITLSTYHITEQTAKALSNEFDNISEINAWRFDLPVYQKDEFGWFIYITDDINTKTMPTDLAKCIEFTKARHCNILCLDGDGSELTCMHKYDW